MIITPALKKALTGLLAALSLAASGSAWAVACNSVAAVNNWSVVATWSCGHVPVAGDDVTITAGGTTTLDVNSNSLSSLTVNGALTVGGNLNVNFAASPMTINNTGTVTIGNSAVARAMIVTGDLHVFGTFIVGATAATHTLSVAAGFNNTGTVNFAPAANRVCNVTFNKNGSMNVSGAGSYTFNLITLNMGASNANVLDMLASYTAPAGFLTITNGTYKHDSPSNITPWITTAGATIPATGGFWLNSAATVTTSGANVTINGGYLRISSGTMNIGNTDTTLLVLGDFATTLFQMDAGALTVTGGINGAAAGAGTFAMSGGTINLQTIDAGAVYTLLLGSASVLKWSGGTIIAQNGNNATDDVDIRSATQNVTGGTLQFGGTDTSTNPWSLINGAGGSISVWNLVIASVTNKGSGLWVSSTVNVLNNVTVNAQNILDDQSRGSFALNVGGGNAGGVWTNNGTFVQGTSTVTFSGTGPASTIAGGTVTIFYNLSLNNANGLTLATGANVSNLATLTNGKITTGANTLFISNGSAIAGAGAGRFVFGNLKKQYAGGGLNFNNFEVGSGVNYAPVKIVLGSVTAAGTLTVTSNTGDHVLIGTSTIDPAKSVNRTWTLITGTVVFAANANNSIAFTFVNPGDMDAGANTANFFVDQYASGAWTPSITPSSRAATATTIQPVSYTQATISGDYQIGEVLAITPPPSSFNAFESSTAAGAVSGKIFTKLAGTAFSLDLVAVLSGVQQVAFTNTVNVSLINVAGAALGANNCPAAPSVIQGPFVANIVAGRSTVAFAAVGAAYRDVRVMINYAPASLTACSADDFSIRPTGFTLTTTTATNSTSAGAPTIKAGTVSLPPQPGTTFDLSAASIAGYDGVPVMDNTKLTGSPTAGTLGGVFSAPPLVAGVPTGTATGNTFVYSEVGNFGLATNGVYDQTFAGVDAATGDCTLDYSNVLVGGKYGCYFGSAPVPAGGGANGFGRFIPDHFDAVGNAPMLVPACVAGNFSYVGQAFIYGTQPVLTVTARNAAGATTTNYAGAYMALSNASLKQGAYVNQSGRYTRFDALGGGNTPVLDTVSGMPTTTTDPAISFPAALSASAGIGTLTFSSAGAPPNPGLIFTRNPTTPSANFAADVALALDVIDGDGVKYANPALPVPADPALYSFGSTVVAGGGISFAPAAGNNMYYGRLRINNANGSELLPLNVSLQTQYFTATSGFVTNTSDQCTTLVVANIGRGNFTGGLTAAVATPSFAGGAFSSGVKTLTLSAPGANKTGTLDLVVNVEAPAAAPVKCLIMGGLTATTGANLTFLRDVQSCSLPMPSFNQDPTAHVTFGVYNLNNKSIYTRENY